MAATTNSINFRWVMDRRSDVNRFLAAAGVGIIAVATLLALTGVGTLGVVFAWTAIALLVLALPWTDWLGYGTRAPSWQRHERTVGNHRLPPL